jgi:hypothetical protein
MTAVENVLALLKTWPAWKRITEAPREIDALRKRIELLEQAIATRAPGPDECPRCHSLTWRLLREEPDPVFGHMGARQKVWGCSSCSHQSIDSSDPGR